MGSNLTWLGSLQEWEIRAQSLTEERLYEDTEMTIIYKHIVTADFWPYIRLDPL